MVRGCLGNEILLLLVAMDWCASDPDLHAVCKFMLFFSCAYAVCQENCLRWKVFSLTMFAAFRTASVSALKLVTSQPEKTAHCPVIGIVD